MLCTHPRGMGEWCTDECRLLMESVYQELGHQALMGDLADFNTKDMPQHDPHEDHNM